MYENGNFESYKDLIVWQKSVDLAGHVYDLTDQLPKTEQFGLSSQMQRAGISIPSNIAEGYDRNHRGEYHQFLGISYGSSAELETQLIICRTRYKNVEYSHIFSLLEEVRKMPRSLLAKQKSR